MAFPVPEPGLVIRYAFLWRKAAARGQDEGDDEDTSKCMFLVCFLDLKFAPGSVPQSGELQIQHTRARRGQRESSDRRVVLDIQSCGAGFTGQIASI